MVGKLDQEDVLADVGGDALQLESLEASPAKQWSMARAEFSEALDETLIGQAGTSHMFGGRHLRCGMLADRLMRRPVRLLACLRLYVTIMISM